MYLKKSNKQKNIACMDQSTVCLFSKTSGLLFVRISKGGLPLAQNDSQRKLNRIDQNNNNGYWLANLCLHLHWLHLRLTNGSEQSELKNDRLRFILRQCFILPLYVLVKIIMGWQNLYKKNMLLVKVGSHMDTNFHNPSRWKVSYRLVPSNGNDIEAKQNEASIIRHFLYRSETNKLILKLWRIEAKRT